MPTANARYQQAYRDRLKETGAARVAVTMPKDVLDVVAATAQHLGVTKQDAVIHLINQGSANVKTNQYREDHSSLRGMTPEQRKAEIEASIRRTDAAIAASKRTSQPDRMTTDEASDLKQLQTKVLNDRLDARELQANGGADGVRRKDALNAMLNASNLHRK